jgi:PAS domain S-box-containing protein
MPEQQRPAGEHRRLFILAAATVAGFTANAAALLAGITIVLPHFLYLPIILASYWFPRRGTLFALAVGLGYLGLVLPFAGTDTALLVSSASRAAVFLAIGVVVSILTLRMREGERRYRGVFDNSEAGTFLVAFGDAEPVIEEANYRGAVMLGSMPKEIVGEPVTRFLKDPDAGIRFLERIRSEGALYEYEDSLLRTDGGIVSVIVSGGRLSDDQAILTVIDITDRKAAETALREANAKLNTLGRLTRNDLLSAVSALFARVEEGMERFEDPDVLRCLGGLDRAARLVQRRAEITRDYQDLGLRPPDWQYPQGMILDVASRLEMPGIEVHSWLERLELYADTMLEAVFLNLLDNAAAHGKTASRVVVTYRLLDGGLEIYVEDDGVGIPEAQKERIFEYGMGSQGGLGLFLVREILSLTGMTIRETGTPGEGARFVIRVPEGGYRIV